MEVIGVTIPSFSNGRSHMRKLFAYALTLSLFATGSLRPVEACQVGGDSVAEDPVAIQDNASLFVSPPSIRRNPIERAPLIAIIDFETTEDVTCSVDVTDGKHTWTQPWDRAATSKHSIAVMGLRPGREHHLRVRATAADTGREEVSPTLRITTDPLPDSFPPLETIVSKPEQMEPGVTVLAVNLWREGTSLLDYGYIVALDNGGEVVWYCRTGDRIADMRVLQNGNIYYQHGSYRFAFEIDILGRDIRQWVATNLTMSPGDHAIPVAVDTMHHDTLEMPNGHMLTLATELREFADFPTSEIDPDAPWASAHVVCDAIVEFMPATGEIVQQMHLVNVLDRRRFGYMALSGFWKDKYNDRIGDYSRDWSHANALIYVPEDNSVIVSFRHLDCLMKIDWESKEIRWILGTPDGWGPAWQKYLLKPKGDLEWAYHQHSPQITPNGTLMMYDNGNYRARPFEQPTLAPMNQSRIVEYRVDETAMTVEQVYEYRGEEGERFYCPFYCEADWLPKTKNILVTDGGHIELKDGTPNDDVPAERQWARIFEITRSEDPAIPTEKVFEVVCDSGLGSPFGWSIYRANRFPNLWDGFSVQPPAADEEIQLFDRSPLQKRE